MRDHTSVGFTSHDLSPAQKIELRTFFKPNWGAEYFVIKNMTIQYAVVYKGDSESIASNMLLNDDYHAQHPSEKVSYSSRRCVDLDCQILMLNKLGRTKVQRSFTFVRSPISHFVSGVVEAHIRGSGVESHTRMNSSVQIRLEHKVTVSKAKAILDSILSIDKRSINRYLRATTHYSVQAYMLYMWRPEFVGVLEHMDTEWQRLQKYLGSNISFKNHNNHLASDDPMDMKASLLTLLKSDKRYTRALCRLLMVDYVCMRDLFALPPECADMPLHK